jgi:hypothetical protein
MVVLFRGFGKLHAPADEVGGGAGVGGVAEEAAAFLERTSETCSFRLVNCVGQPPVTGTVHSSRAPVMSLTNAAVHPSGESRHSATVRISDNCSGL